MSAPHDAPSAAELVEAVREFLAADVHPEAEGRVRFHLLVAMNVLAMVEREIELGSAHAAAHAERLERLGVRDDRELAAKIRGGEIAVADALPLVRESVVDKLSVANPRYLRDPPDGSGTR